MSTLLVTSGHHVGRRFALGEAIRLGRALDNEIVLPDNLVSRYHAQIERSGFTYVVTDLDSRNGVFINDKKHADYRLRRGDRIRIGETTLVYEAPQELKTARFTNTLVHLDPDQDDTMRVVEQPGAAEAEPAEATGLILKLAQVFETASAELPDVLKTILAHLLELMGATAGSILLRGREDEVIPLTAISQGDELHISREATKTALTEGKAVLAASFFAPPGGGATRRARKAMIVPMFDRENVFGAIHLERPEGKDYALKDIAFLQALSRLVSGSIRQAMRIDQLGQAQDQAGAARTILGESESIRTMRNQLNRVAATDATVLILGETGTGKELVAQALHSQSSRATGPFVPINCAAIPETLIESELFGYERGAFTGAEKMKRGKVEMADGGTLFLDEIGEMKVELQAKLLRFLEERIFYRVGGVRPIQTDARILAASNRDLDEAVAQGRFRKDLFYRLNVVAILAPPLRERPGDIRIIVDEFAPKLAARLGRPFVKIDDPTWIALQAYSWPGNVRELLQSLERALILSDNGVLLREDFQIPEPPEESDTTGSYSASEILAAEGAAKGKDQPQTLAEMEEKAIADALRFAKGNKVRAAQILGIHRNTLRNKIIEYGIEL